jgi:hypothetical protein
VALCAALASRAEALAWAVALLDDDAVQLASTVTWQESVGAAITLATFDRQLWADGQKGGRSDLA